MATIALRKYYTSNDTWWADIQTALGQMGWTLHDDIDANNKVYKSNGESGDKPWIYAKIIRSTTNFNVELYLYWNAGNHTGAVKAAKAGSLPYTVNNYYMISGNKDMFVLVKEDRISHITGYPNRKFYATVTTTTADITAGDNVDVPVISSTGFKKGSKYQFVGANGEGRDQVSCVEVTDETHVKIQNVPRNYASGAFLGVTPCPAVQGTYQGAFSLLCPYNAAGTVDDTNTWNAKSFVTVTDLDPEQVHGYWGLVPWYVDRSDISALAYNDQILLQCPAVTFNDVFGITAAGTPEQGTATSATSTTLVDSSKSWGNDAWKDKYVIIADGTGKGQARKISGNDGTTLTIATAWDTTPDVTSTYRIVDTVYRSVCYSTYNWALLEDRAAL